MPIIDLHYNLVDHSDRFHVFLLKVLLDSYSDNTGVTLRKTKWIRARDEHGLPVLTISKNNIIGLISKNDWDGFKTWFYNQGVTVNMKKREIDQNKVWWPCVIEITVDGDDNDNEYWVWAKLVET
jgi:hypothetical protein